MESALVFSCVLLLPFVLINSETMVYKSKLPDGSFEVEQRSSKNPDGSNTVSKSYSESHTSSSSSGGMSLRSFPNFDHSGGNGMKNLFDQQPNSFPSFPQLNGPSGLFDNLFGGQNRFRFSRNLRMPYDTPQFPFRPSVSNFGYVPNYPWIANRFFENNLDYPQGKK